MVYFATCHLETSKLHIKESTLKF